MILIWRSQMKWVLNPLGNIHKNQNKTPLKWIYFYCSLSQMVLPSLYPAVSSTFFADVCNDSVCGIRWHSSGAVYCCVGLFFPVCMQFILYHPKSCSQFTSVHHPTMAVYEFRCVKTYRFDDEAEGVEHGFVRSSIRDINSSINVGTVE